MQTLAIVHRCSHSLATTLQSFHCCQSSPSRPLFFSLLGKEKDKNFGDPGIGTPGPVPGSPGPVPEFPGPTPRSLGPIPGSPRCTAPGNQSRDPGGPSGGARDRSRGSRDRSRGLRDWSCGPRDQSRGPPGPVPERQDQFRVPGTPGLVPGAPGPTPAFAGAPGEAATPPVGGGGQGVVTRVAAEKVKQTVTSLSIDFLSLHVGSVELLPNLWWWPLSVALPCGMESFRIGGIPHHQKAFRDLFKFAVPSGDRVGV